MFHYRMFRLGAIILLHLGYLCVSKLDIYVMVALESLSESGNYMVESSDPPHFERVFFSEGGGGGLVA